MISVPQIKFFILLLVIAFLLSFCKGKPTSNNIENISKYKESLIRVNKYLFENDIAEINSYCKQKKWNVNVSETGLRYLIYKKGNGIKAETGKVAVIRYTVRLLDGKLCYTSDSLGLKSFMIGKGLVERGLDEGVSLLQVGDKAHFILHPGLAFGLLGDEKKIPSHSTIVYDVELISISD